MSDTSYTYYADELVEFQNKRHSQHNIPHFSNT